MDDYTITPLHPSVGDSVTLVITHCDKRSISDKDASISASEATAASDEAAYTILDWHIDEGEDGNVLTVHFIPWVTGSIQLMPIAGVTPPLVTVVSVLQQDVAQAQPRPQQGPLFSPITIHALYASAGAVVCALMALCVAVAKWRKIHAWFRLSAMQATELRNARALKRRLAELLKGTAGDAAFCTELQQAIRSYLGTRFDEDFAPLTTGEVAARVAAKTAVAAAETEEAYDDVIDVLRRTDYVRFSLAPMEAHERDGLVERVLTASDVLRGKTNA